MYIIKNAFKCISRSKGRNILIGIIALVIAVSACIGLSIRQAAQSAKQSTLENMSVTATISFDRSLIMNDMREQMGSEVTGRKEFNKEDFASIMGESSSLTLEEYTTYSQAESVDDFYYTLTVYFNGSDGFEAVSNDSSTEIDSIGENGGFSFGGMAGGRMNSAMRDVGDFTVIGYSADSAMTDFKNGVSSVTDGSVFEQATTEYECIISEELATYNSIKTGDTITLTNVNAENEKYTLTVVGIYSSSENNEFSMSMFGASQDPANKIYMSAQALSNIVETSEQTSTTVTDEDSGREYETKLTSTLNATYVFNDVESYNAFESEVRDLGLDESYTVSSTDLTQFENSLTPLNTLSTMAGWFLVVIFVIGAIILIVLNIFNVRERKYEIGVLTAMGMKKYKVAMQFVCEILIVTMVAVIIGVAIGAISSVPVTNMLLENQAESQNAQQTQIQNNFGRPGNMSGQGKGDSMPQISGGGGFDKLFSNTANYITEVNSAMNLTVVLQMILIGLLLTVVASAVSVLFVMRYDPLKILSNRD